MTRPHLTHFFSNSSCMALSDLLSGRSVDDMLESIPRLWELCFRARDDIKVCYVYVVCCILHFISIGILVTGCSS